jgi:hypothetical protein
MVGTTKIDVLSLVNYKNDWVVDSSYGHHLTRSESKFQAFEITKEMMQSSQQTIPFILLKRKVS